eukprot:62357_1
MVLFLNPQSDVVQGGARVIVIKKKKGKQTKKCITNELIVPYNAGLLLKYDCHINVEICSTIKSVQYLYKYVIAVDEIKQYVDSRLISATESFWDLLSFFRHGKHPSVLPLEVHTENNQMVNYSKNDKEQATKACEKAKVTKLTAWFDNN